MSSAGVPLGATGRPGGDRGGRRLPRLRRRLLRHRGALERRRRAHRRVTHHRHDATWPHAHDRAVSDHDPAAGGCPRGDRRPRNRDGRRVAAPPRRGAARAAGHDARDSPSCTRGQPPRRLAPRRARRPAGQHGLQIHGVRPRAWSVETAEADAVTATLSFTSPAFPFAHTVHQEVRVAPGALRITTSVIATGGVGVPIAFGFHPYLVLPGVRAPRGSSRSPHAVICSRTRAASRPARRRGSEPSGRRSGTGRSTTATTGSATRRGSRSRAAGVGSRSRSCRDIPSHRSSRLPRWMPCASSR